jgi:hypothetical protein
MRCQKTVVQNFTSLRKEHPHTCSDGINVRMLMVTTWKNKHHYAMFLDFSIVFIFYLQ